MYRLSPIVRRFAPPDTRPVRPGLGFALCAALWLALVAPAQAQTPDNRSAASLSIHVTGLASTAGNIMLALFDSEAAYTDGKSPLRGIQLDPSKGPLEVRLSLPAGRYAIKAYHDLNGNGKLDMNLFNVPTEPVAFSNHALPHMGPPSWTEASFAVDAGDNSQTVVIQ